MSSPPLFYMARLPKDDGMGDCYGAKVTWITT